MNKLLQTTAIALLLTVPGVAYAQSTNTGTDTNTQTQTQTDATQPATGDTNTTTQTDSMQPATEDNTTATQGSATTQTGDSEQANRSSGTAVFWVFEDAERQGAMRASNLIGMNVYTVERDIDESAYYNTDARRDWEDVGHVNDVILNWDGSVRAVIFGVGGFLGLGEKDVAIDMSSLRRVRESGDSDDWFLVVNSSKTALESAPAYRPAS